MSFHCEITSYDGGRYRTVTPPEAACGPNPLNAASLTILLTAELQGIGRPNTRRANGVAYKPFLPEPPFLMPRRQPAAAARHVQHAPVPTCAGRRLPKAPAMARQRTPFPFSSAKKADSKKGPASANPPAMARKRTPYPFPQPPPMRRGGWAARPTKPQPQPPTMARKRTPFPFHAAALSNMGQSMASVDALVVVLPQPTFMKERRRPQPQSQTPMMRRKRTPYPFVVAVPPRMQRSSLAVPVEELWVSQAGAEEKWELKWDADESSNSSWGWDLAPAKQLSVAPAARGLPVPPRMERCVRATTIIVSGVASPGREVLEENEDGEKWLPMPPSLSASSDTDSWWWSD